MMEYQCKFRWDPYHYYIIKASKIEVLDPMKFFGTDPVDVNKLFNMEHIEWIHKYEIKNDEQITNN